jgi:hypothetical protein
MRLFHFSDDPAIVLFTPRPVRVPSERRPGREWLNGPLVWAIDDVHQPMYLFPRDCPRILLWSKADSSEADRERWFGGSDCRVIAHVEWAWFDRLCTASIHRYELPAEPFESLDDAGMYVARTPVEPVAVDTLCDLPSVMREQGVELRVMDSLTPLREVWGTTLHASGIRLRNARAWNG